MIEARSLGKVYYDAGRPLEIFGGVSFTVETGRTLAVVGPSGCGKTTLLNILSGLDRPSAGQAFLGGRSLSDLNDKALAELRNASIGFVFQSYHLLPEFTALENVMLPGLIGRRPVAEVRARAMTRLEEVGLAERGGHYPSQLSGGESQRAAIARALVNDPKYLFCDEPTGNLDRQRAGEIIGLLKRVLGGPTTAVIVTHDERVAAVADRVIDATDGRWRESGNASVVAIDAAANA